MENTQWNSWTRSGTKGRRGGRSLAAVAGGFSRNVQAQHTATRQGPARLRGSSGSLPARQQADQRRQRHRALRVNDSAVRGHLRHQKEGWGTGRDRERRDEQRCKSVVCPICACRTPSGRQATSTVRQEPRGQLGNRKERACPQGGVAACDADVPWRRRWHRRLAKQQFLPVVMDGAGGCGWPGSWRKGCCVRDVVWGLLVVCNVWGVSVIARTWVVSQALWGALLMIDPLS